MSTMPDPASACRCTFQPGPSQGHINSVPDKSPRSPTECVIAERMHLHAVRLLSAPKQRVVQHAGTCCGCSLCKSSSFAGRWGWYDKYFAYTMAYGMQDYERNIAARKETLFANLFQLPVESLLEIGIGTGPNTRYYAAQQGMRITGIDPNPEMAPFAVEAAQSAKLNTAQITLLQGTAEQLPVDSQSQDAVVCTLVLCSVPNVATALSEVKRVLKPGGKFLFVEHVLAPDRPLRIMQHVLNPLQQAAADGCHLDRNTLASIKTAGFASVDAESFVVPKLGLIGPHTAGIACMHT